MAGHEPDFDDWFDEPAPPPERRRRGGRAADEDAWTIPDAASRREPLLIAGMPVTTRALAIVGVLAVVFLVGILAAAGVFSGGSPKTAPTIPTTPATVAPPASSTPLTTTAATPATTAPTTTLKPGDTGAQVTTLQNELAALGYSAGKADGNYGPATKQAVTNFQTAQGLTADGVVGPQTLAALQRAAGG